MMLTGDVVVGVDVDKQAHYTQVLSPDGSSAFDRPVPNDETALRRLIGDAAALGRVVLVIDQPSSVAQLLLTGARDTVTSMST